MQLVNEIAIEKAARRHPQVGSWLARWAVVVRAAEWTCIVDVRKTYPHADAIRLRSGGKVTLIVTCFKVGGNDFRLLTTISYQGQRVTAIDLLNQAEYSKNKWKKGMS